MTATAAIALLTEIIANLPAIVTTGEQVIKLVNDSYKALGEALADRDATPQEIDALVKRIVANSAAIQAIA
jgi:hypothetical protein